MREITNDFITFQFLFLILLALLPFLGLTAQNPSSPDKKITVSGSSVQYEGQSVLTVNNFKTLKFKFGKTVNESYEMLSGKKANAQIPAKNFSRKLTKTPNSFCGFITTESLFVTVIMA